MMRDLPAPTRKKVLLVTVGVALAGLMLVRNMVLAPHEKRMRSLSSQYAVETQKSDLLQTLSALDERMEGYKGALAASRETSWLIGELNKMAAASDVQLRSAAPLGEEKLGDYRRVTMRAEAAGSFHEIGDLAARIEGGANFVKISSARLEPPVDLATAPPGELAASLHVSVYLREGEGAR